MTYEPIKDFNAWSAGCTTATDMASFLEKLAGLRNRVQNDVVTETYRKIDREAAAETGAIEGMYELAAGATKTIADKERGLGSLAGKQRWRPDI